MIAAQTIKGVVFDLDGLLFNTEDLYGEVGAEILRRRGKEWTQDLLDAMMGRPGAIALQVMIDWHHLDDTVEDLRAESDEVFRDLLDTKLAPMPGAVDLLASLGRADVAKRLRPCSLRCFLAVNNVVLLCLVGLSLFLLFKTGVRFDSASSIFHRNR